MPHFGLMDEGKMTTPEALLLRARLHLRCGRRRLQEDKLPEAISTLYDALLSSMRWYAITDESVHRELHELGDCILEDDQQLQKLLLRFGAWDASLNFEHIGLLLDYALYTKDISVDKEQLMQQIEAVLTRLGVLPFDEERLPPEDPQTF